MKLLSIYKYYHGVDKLHIYSVELYPIYKPVFKQVTFYRNL